MSAFYLYCGLAYALSYASTSWDCDWHINNTPLATLSALHTQLICEGLLHINATFRFKTRKFSNIEDYLQIYLLICHSSPRYEKKNEILYGRVYEFTIVSGMLQYWTYAMFRY